MSRTAAEFGGPVITQGAHRRTAAETLQATPSTAEPMDSLMDHPAAATAAMEVVVAVEAAAAAEETEARPNALSFSLEGSRIDLTAVDVLGRWCGAKESRLTWPVGSRSRNELAERRSGAWVQLGTPLTCTLRF